MSGVQAPTLSVSDVTKLVASDYEMTYNATGFTITRRSDGKVLTDAQVPPSASAALDVIAEIDGLQIHNPFGGTANSGDRFLFKPFSTSASNIAGISFLHPEHSQWPARLLPPWVRATRQLAANWHVGSQQPTGLAGCGDYVYRLQHLHPQRPRRHCIHLHPRPGH